MFCWVEEVAPFKPLPLPQSVCISVVGTHIFLSDGLTLRLTFIQQTLSFVWPNLTYPNLTYFQRLTLIQQTLSFRRQLFRRWPIEQRVLREMPTWQMSSSWHELEQNHVRRSEEDSTRAKHQEKRWSGGFGDASTRSWSWNVDANCQLYQVLN